MNWKKSIVLKKARRHGVNIVRPVLKRLHSNSNAAVLVNSFPKSGTHLLTQVIEPLTTTDYGNFIASTPSFTMKEEKEDALISRLGSIIGGELCSAHIFHSMKIESAITQNNIKHLFIYRDPRDVILSEVHYITTMNRWHKLHKIFSKLRSFDEKLNLAIQGLNKNSSIYYPDIAQRMRRFSPWIKSENVLAIKYEELKSPQSDDIYRMIWAHVAENNPDLEISFEDYRLSLIESIDPLRSHTYRAGGQGWKECFPKDSLDIIYNVAEEEIKDWGYPV